MDFLEVLPPSCPPQNAKDQEVGKVFRAVTKKKPTLDDFRSQASKGAPKKSSIDECRYASCSFFTCKNKLRKVFRFPKTRERFGYLATVNVTRGAGLSLIKRQHVDLWICASFDPSSAVVDIEPL